MTAPALNGYHRHASHAPATQPDKLPPQNLEAEQSVLGSILLDNETLDDIVLFLAAEDFYRDTHQTIYRAMLALYGAGTPVDAVTLADELTRTGDLEAIGGDATLERLLDSVPHAANGKYHAQIVKQKAIGRALLDVYNAGLRDIYSNNFTAEELLASAESQVFAIADAETTADVKPLTETLHETMARVLRRQEDGAPADGLLTGFPDLDDMLGGLRPKSLVIVGARPSAGKTAWALQVADYVATTRKVTALFVSLEMGRDELTERLLVSHSRVDNHKVRTGQGITPRERAELMRAYQELGQSSLLIDDAPGRTMLQIFAAARRAKLRSNLGLVVIDYIQLVDADNERDSRQEQVAKISRKLKAMAREIGVPVIALSQLNRQVETREDRRPRMADLRESGAIEQDADIVVLLHRPEYYDPNDQPGVAEVIVGKNRHGAVGKVNLTFLKNIGRFESLELHAAPPPPIVTTRREDAPF